MILRDPVHGLVAFESSEDAIIPRLLATAEVQRLRRIRQLGVTSLVFPGAEHTRFAHAIGAAHVMQRLLGRLRQLDNALPFWQRVTSERARDSIAAALLHDLGHGPLSHLFEEIMPGAASHESWTEKILLDPQTEVHRVLVADDPNLPRRVVDLIRARHPLPYLANAVSGTFDVDRCDYLLRDAHATGARYGDFDLPWLLRSLRFDDGDAPGLAIDGLKGIAAIEAFILARFFMFQQVYFHKASRAAELLMRAIFRRAMVLLQGGTRLPSVPLAIASLASGDPCSLGDYLELDDATLYSTIHAWEAAKDPILRDLCARLRARALFKTVEIFRQPGDEGARSAEAALGTARDIAQGAGIDPEYYVGLDVATDVPYSDDAFLKVLFPKGPPRSPSEVSFLLARLKNETISRTRIIFAPEIRETVQGALLT